MMEVLPIPSARGTVCCVEGYRAIVAAGVGIYVGIAGPHSSSDRNSRAVALEGFHPGIACGKFLSVFRTMNFPPAEW